MGKKKPLDIGTPAFFGQHPQRNRVPPAPAILFLAILVAAAVWLSLPSQHAQPQDARIEMFLASPAPFFENSSAKVRVFSSCGNFSLYLDGAKIAEGGSRAEAAIKSKVGAHTLVARNAACSDSLSFSVLLQECDEGQQRACVAGQCQGVQSCAGGVFSECVLPLKACVPGERTGCSLDNCKFGYMECNSCGTGFGGCKPEAASANAANSLVCPKE